MRVRHRRAIAIGLGVTLTPGVAGYAAAGFAVLQIRLSESGGCHAEHATFAFHAALGS